MKSVFTYFISLFAAFSLAFSPVFLYANVVAQDSADRKIVVFKNYLSDEEKEAVLRDAGAQKIKHLKTAKSSVALVDKSSEAKLLARTEISRLDDDVLVFALEQPSANAKGGAKPVPPQPSEVLPWGVDRVDAELVWDVVVADLVRVAVIDTGIELSHPDLKDNIKGQYNAIDNKKSANDDNGHGTHVAGTIAAIDNTIGVIGVAHKTDLLAVKVLNRNGSGFLSDIIEGIDWAVANGANVVNMSLGTVSNVQSFHDAVIRAYNSGIVLVAAAGNDYGGPVNFPAAYPEIIAVSATDSNNQIANFSSVGPEIDLAAPGVNVYSTYKGSTYKNLNGTSMATPHVAGAAALLFSVPAKCDANGDGTCSPSEIQSKLETTAIDLGSSGKDSHYGSGLANAFAAVQ